MNTTTGQNGDKSKIALPPDYDYIACYLTDFCFLKCDYCITDHNGTGFTSGKQEKFQPLSVEKWLDTFSRIEFPTGVVPTLQGGEPFLYKGIWEIIENSPVPLDILTALPPVVKPEKFAKLKNLDNLRRNAAYPNVRVSYHIGQNKIEDLAPRVKELQDLFSIGIFIVDHPGHPDEAKRAKELCDKHGVLFKAKEYLGYHEGKLYGTYLYPDASVGKVTKPMVYCRNSVLIISPSGDIYRCHSDLYHKRHDLKLGNITDPSFKVDDGHNPCFVYGLCSECDVKIKNNHFQSFGYTSANIRFPEASTVEVVRPELRGRDSLRVV